MSDLYFRRKQQLSNSVDKTNVIDVHNEMAKKRNASPAPAPRSSSVNKTDKKIAYKHDLELFRKQIESQCNDIAVSVASHKNEIHTTTQAIEHKVETINKSMESTKYESLKNDVKATMDKMNASIRNVCDQMITIQDKITVLQSQMDEISEMLE